MKSKRAKMCDISDSVRKTVRERDGDRCVWCGAFLQHPQLCHYISRQNGGLGIPENLVCGCVYCHMQADQGSHTRKYKQVQEIYLKSHYPEWDKSKLKYKRKYQK